MLTYTLSSMISCDKQYSFVDNVKIVSHIPSYLNKLSTHSITNFISNWKQPIFMKDHICSWFHSFQPVHFLSISSISNLYVIFFVSMPWYEVYLHHSILMYYLKHLYNAIWSVFTSSNIDVLFEAFIQRNMIWSVFTSSNIDVLFEAFIQRNMKCIYIIQYWCTIWSIYTTQYEVYLHHPILMYYLKYLYNAIWNVFTSSNINVLFEAFIQRNMKCIYIIQYWCTIWSIYTTQYEVYLHHPILMYYLKHLYNAIWSVFTSFNTIWSIYTTRYVKIMYDNNSIFNQYFSIPNEIDSWIMTWT